MNTTIKPLHHFDLGAVMSDEEIAIQLRRIKSSDGLRAVLQHLRNKSLEVCVAGRQPPLMPGINTGEYRAYHAGGADALEEVFRGLHAFADSEEPEDEEETEGKGS